ncbi:hypothetical protein AArc1_3040 [Natrarchaeobaculum sulfurireducens]|uniref:Uncharacterized protein n=1 Tax=Natrarchaeobaculum sulfurireducens TaxID=2044521 RepID=A0A346PIK2_9EURY|nr:hypothetical protein AArc1_3040 [Natrarchaeobaculum sulfurireducens]
MSYRIESDDAARSGFSSSVSRSTPPHELTIDPEWTARRAPTEYITPGDDVSL